MYTCFDGSSGHSKKNHLRNSNYKPCLGFARWVRRGVIRVLFISSERSDRTKISKREKERVGLSRALAACVDVGQQCSVLSIHMPHPDVARCCGMLRGARNIFAIHGAQCDHTQCSHDSVPAEQGRLCYFACLQLNAEGGRAEFLAIF